METKQPKQSKLTVLTPVQVQFIEENRLNLSMVDLSKILGISFNKVRKYMIENGLKLTNEEVQRIRIEKTYGIKPGDGKKEPKEETISRKWVPDPWNHGLNLITMLPVNRSIEEK